MQGRNTGGKPFHRAPLSPPHLVRRHKLNVPGGIHPIVTGTKPLGGAGRGQGRTSRNYPPTSLFRGGGSSTPMSHVSSPSRNREPPNFPTVSLWVQLLVLDKGSNVLKTKAPTALTINRYFRQYGKIHSLRFGRGDYAFVNFWTIQNAENAMQNLNGAEKPVGLIRLKWAHPPPKHPLEKVIADRERYHAALQKEHVSVPIVEQPRKHGMVFYEDGEGVLPTCSLWVAIQWANGSFFDPPSVSEMEDMFQGFGRIFSLTTGPSTYSFANFMDIQTAKNVKYFYNGRRWGRDGVVRMRWAPPPQNHPLYFEIVSLKANLPPGFANGQANRGTGASTLAPSVAAFFDVVKRTTTPPPGIGLNPVPSNDTRAPSKVNEWGKSPGPRSRTTGAGRGTVYHNGNFRAPGANNRQKLERNDARYDKTFPPPVAPKSKVEEKKDALYNANFPALGASDYAANHTNSFQKDDKRSGSLPSPRRGVLGANVVYKKSESPPLITELEEAEYTTRAQRLERIRSRIEEINAKIAENGDESIADAEASAMLEEENKDEVEEVLDRMQTETDDHFRDIPPTGQGAHDVGGTNVLDQDLAANDAWMATLPQVNAFGTIEVPTVKEELVDSYHGMNIIAEIETETEPQPSSHVEITEEMSGKEARAVVDDSRTGPTEANEGSIVEPSQVSQAPAAAPEEKEMPREGSVAVADETLTGSTDLPEIHDAEPALEDHADDEPVAKAVTCDVGIEKGAEEAPVPVDTGSTVEEENTSTPTTTPVTEIETVAGDPEKLDADCAPSVAKGSVRKERGVESIQGSGGNPETVQAEPNTTKDKAEAEDHSSDADEQVPGADEEESKKERPRLDAGSPEWKPKQTKGKTVGQMPSMELGGLLHHEAANVVRKNAIGAAGSGSLNPSHERATKPASAPAKESPGDQLKECIDCETLCTWLQGMDTLYYT